MSSKIKFTIVISFALLVFVAGFYYYGFYRHKKMENPTPASSQTDDKQKGPVLLKASLLVQSFISAPDENHDFKKVAEEIGDFLNSSDSVYLNGAERGEVELAQAMALSESDPLGAMNLLKTIAINEQYPKELRSKAALFVAEKYESNPGLNYGAHVDFAKAAVFSGEKFQDFLKADDVSLAARKLYEWSFELSPSPFAGYLIAGWYAGKIYSNPEISQSDREMFLEEANDWLGKSDILADSQSDQLKQSVQNGLNYAVKARAVYMLGKDKAKAEDLYLKSLEIISKNPKNFFQNCFLDVVNFKYAVFLAREYGNSRAKEINGILKTFSGYLGSNQKPNAERIGLVKNLIAARDSDRNDYPFPDFNKTDLQNLEKINPEFKKMVDGLNFSEYIKGTSLEEKYNSGELKMEW